jgi:hypothetical protein
LIRPGSFPMATVGGAVLIVGVYRLLYLRLRRA